MDCIYIITNLLTTFYFMLSGELKNLKLFKNYFFLQFFQNIKENLKKNWIDGVRVNFIIK